MYAYLFVCLSGLYACRHAGMQSSNGAILGDGTHVCDDVDTTSFGF